jgi:hypothetical protein
LNTAVAGSAVKRLGQVLAPQVGMLGAITFTNWVAPGLNLGIAPENLWIKSLVDLAYFNVAGLGLNLIPGYRALNQKIRVETELAIRGAGQRFYNHLAETFQPPLGPGGIAVALETPGSVKMGASTTDLNIYRAPMTAAKALAGDKYSSHPLFQKIQGIEEQASRLGNPNSTVNAADHLRLAAELYDLYSEGSKLNSGEGRRLCYERLSEIAKKYNDGARPRISFAELKNLADALPTSFHGNKEWTQLWLAYGMIVTRFGETPPKQLHGEIQKAVRDAFGRIDKRTEINAISPQAVHHLGRQLMTASRSQDPSPTTAWVSNLLGLLSEYHSETVIQKLSASFMNEAPLAKARASAATARRSGRPAPLSRAAAPAAAIPSPSPTIPQAAKIPIELAPPQQEIPAHPNLAYRISPEVQALLDAYQRVPDNPRLISAAAVDLVFPLTDVGITDVGIIVTINPIPQQCHAATTRTLAQSKIRWLANATGALPAPAVTELLADLRRGLTDMVSSLEVPTPGTDGTLTLPRSARDFPILAQNQPSLEGIRRSSLALMATSEALLHEISGGADPRSQARGFFAALESRTTRLRDSVPESSK